VGTENGIYEGLARSIGRRSLPAHLAGCIGDKTLSAVQGSTFSSARPFPHVVLDDFLSPTFCRQLLEEFPRFNPKYAVDENGAIGGKATHSDVCSIGPAYQKLDELIQSRAFLDLLSGVTGIPDLLYDPDYLGGGTHENMDGQSLDFHVDFNYHHVYRWHRRINLILFLNEQWQDEWGGLLELRETPDQPGDVRVAPAFNRAVIFETNEVSWHGFSKVSLPDGSSLSRRSIALYFYTKDRPVEQTAPPRSTVYVEDYLPGHLVEGYTLDADDVALLRSLIDRRDLHIARLYQHERDLTAQVFELQGKERPGLADRFKNVAERLTGKLAGSGNKSNAGKDRELSVDLPFVRFSQSNVRKQLLQGWGDTEKSMVWSVGASSVLEISLPASAELNLHFECQPFAVADAPPQSITVFLNDARQGVVTLEPDKKSYAMPLAESDQLQGVNKLRFEYAYTTSPRDIGINADDRQLAVAWFNLWLSD
jgi:hypothetical protein